MFNNASYKLKQFVERLKNAHHLSDEFEHEILRVSEVCIWFESQKITANDRKTIKKGLKKINNYIGKIEDELIGLSKTNIIFSRYIAEDMDLIYQLENSQKELTKMFYKKNMPAFTVLKQNINDIFCKNNIKYTNTYNPYLGNDDTYNLLELIRDSAGIHGDFDPRVDK